jgi:rSAM/selenodomain-associated transferase 2
MIVDEPRMGYIRVMMAVSVIIPALNEAPSIAATIASLRRQGPCEIVVVDGGSSDGTTRLAQSADAVLAAPPGRALQMNLGAQHAHGDHLLFLHADCRLGPGGLIALAQTLAKRGVAAGCFSMCVQAEGWLYRSIDAAAGLRVRLAGLVYGDQGLFVRRDDFFRLGGFPAVRFMEDVLLSRRLAGLGRVVVLPQKILVAPRRWQRVGLIRQTLRNWTLTALALGGVHPDRLARFYPDVR